MALFSRRERRPGYVKDLRKYWLQRPVERSTSPDSYDRNSYRFVLEILVHGMIANQDFTAFQWLIYDSFKVSLGLPTTGGH